MTANTDLTYYLSLKNYTNFLEYFSGKTISTSKKKHLMRRSALASTHTKIVATASPTVIYSMLELVRTPESSLCDIAKPVVNILA